MIQTLFGSLEQPEKKQSIFVRMKERMQEGLTRTRESLTERIDDSGVLTGNGSAWKNLSILFGSSRRYS